jgi:hypothetical protein
MIKSTKGLEEMQNFKDYFGSETAKQPEQCPKSNHQNSSNTLTERTSSNKLCRLGIS